MNIAIIGYGFVGKAVHSVIKSRNIVQVIDPEYSSFDEVDIKLLDLVFLCLPTPTIDGRCDDSLVLDYISKLKDYPGLVAIKSTIPPATVEKVLSIRPTTVVWPELLREDNANHDIKYPTTIVVGAPSRVQFDFVDRFIREETDILWQVSLQDSRFTKAKMCSPIEASIFKYAVNSFLATKVVFFHQMYRWMETRGDGESYAKVTELLRGEGRVGSSHMDVPYPLSLGFGGSCFPKDVEAFIDQVYHEDKTTFPLLSEMYIQNQKF